MVVVVIIDDIIIVAIVVAILTLSSFFFFYFSQGFWERLFTKYSQRGGMFFIKDRTRKIRVGSTQV